MFGYISINKDEMKIKDYKTYHSFYCGLCHKLKADHGRFGQMSLSYDMTFLEVLLTGLYEPKSKARKARCLMHPTNKHEEIMNCYTSYVADMNLLLSYLKCEDDWLDDHKYSRYTAAKVLFPEYQKVKEKYPKKVARIEDAMQEIAKGEKSNSKDIDFMAGRFGAVLGETFVYKNDIWAKHLYQIGFYLGKFIYLMDAYEDVEEDIKNHNYNLLKEQYHKGTLEEEGKVFLTMMIAECCKEFEKLPILQHVDILRNILYSGIWTKYEYVHNKRKIRQEKEDARSV